MSRCFATRFRLPLFPDVQWECLLFDRKPRCPPLSQVDKKGRRAASASSAGLMELRPSQSTASSPALSPVSQSVTLTYPALWLAIAETPSSSLVPRWPTEDRRLARRGTLSLVRGAAFGVRPGCAKMAAAALLAVVDRNQLRRVPILLLQPRWRWGRRVGARAACGALGHVSGPLRICVVLVGAVPLQPVGSPPGACVTGWFLL